MDKKGESERTKTVKKKPTVYGTSYTDLDPVLEQSRKDHSKETKLVIKPLFAGQKLPNGETKIQPSMSTRLELQKTSCFEPGIRVERTKYVPPRTRKQKRAQSSRRKRLEDQLNFCKKQVYKLPAPENVQKIHIKLESPSAELQNARILPHKPSVTPSELYPDPPRRKDLNLKKPKSGIFINEKAKMKKRLPRKKKHSRKNKHEAVARKSGSFQKQYELEEQMARELATIEEITEGLEAESGQDFTSQLPENYLTKQFRKKVSQMSKTTSIRSKDYEIGSEEEGEGLSEVDKMIQKFRRDSECKRYQRPVKKFKKGTLENFSYTKLKQPTLKTFYYGVKIGTNHQADEHFPLFSRNKQGICMPIAAYCFSILKHPDRWSQADIDDVLEAGNSLYMESTEHHHIHEEARHLTPNDLQKYCILGDHKIRFEVSKPELSGMVRSDDRKVYNLTKAINVFFVMNEACILQTGELCVAIWKDRHYYFFDASPRTVDLFSNPRGAALMANFYDTTAVVTVLLNRSDLKNVPFVLYSIKAYKILPKHAEEVDSTGHISEMDNYKILDEEKAIASGSFDLGDKCFGFSRNKQALTVAVVALVYSKITPASAWHKLTLDKIMIIGNQLFLECIKQIEMEEMCIDHLPAVFTIGPYVVEIFICRNRVVDFLHKKGECMLPKKLEDFFEKGTNAILQIDGSTLAIWKQRDMFHCFDGYSRNTEGLPCRDGAACVSMHTNIDSLSALIAKNFEKKDAIFRLHALKVCKIHRDPDQMKTFPKNLTMNDYPVEDFKRVKMCKSRRRATNRKVTVDYAQNATRYCPQESILEVGSKVRSLTMEEVPAMVHKWPSKSMLKPPKEGEVDFIADLDSPSLSDTQIEPPPLEEDEKQMEFIDLDAYELTQEEKELQERGEGEGAPEEEGEERDDVKETDSEVEARLEEEMIAGQEDEDWYMAQTEYTQVHSMSLLSYHSKLSQEVNTDLDHFHIPSEEIEPLVRRGLAQSKRKTPCSELSNQYEFELTEEPDVTLSEELAKETNYMELPDDTQIVLGTKNMAQFGQDIELMAPFVCVMACAVAKKYAIDSWSKDIVDYILKCGVELQRATNTRYDQVYKLEIDRICLGRNDFEIQVNYVYDSLIKANVLEVALKKILFPKYQCGILVTPTYSCAVFYKHHLFYLYDGFGNNEVGLSKGPKNEGVACAARFKDVKPLVSRILHNKGKRESQENVEYNRFVLSYCVVKHLSKVRTLEEEVEEEEKYEHGEGYDYDDNNDVPVKRYRKDEMLEEPKVPENIIGYQNIDGVYKIEGTRGITMNVGERSDNLKEDYFVCLCACLLTLNNPVKKWDRKKVDLVLEDGQRVFENAKDLAVSSKKLIKNVLVEDHLFNVSAKKVEFTTYKARRTLKSGFETMVMKKHEHFILQFPNRSYAISLEDGFYHIFDPSDPSSGRACWTKYGNFHELLRRIRNNVARGSESYNFHVFDVTSITKAPKAIVLSTRLKKYKLQKEKKLETVGKPFHEEVFWLDVEPLPWSGKTKKDDAALWHCWFVIFPEDLFSLFGSLCVCDSRFPKETQRKQTLANIVTAIGMTQIYELADWTPAILDSVLVNGDNYFRECVKEISEDDYELSVTDLKRECTIFPYGFQVKITPAVNGTMFLKRLKQFNLYKGLRFFFDDFETRFGIITVIKSDVCKKNYGFGKCHDGEYFLYDCETLGPPMFIEKGSGRPYVLRCTTLNRLLHVMTLTLRGGDFFIFDIALSELNPMA